METIKVLVLVELLTAWVLGAFMCFVVWAQAGFGLVDPGLLVRVFLVTALFTIGAIHLIITFIVLPLGLIELVQRLSRWLTRYES